jgi:hypothetical protein
MDFSQDGIVVAEAETGEEGVRVDDQGKQQKS